MVIIDTTIWVDYFKGLRTPETEWLEAQIDRKRLGIGDWILCEVLQGIREEPMADAILSELLKLDIVGMGGADNAIAAARNYRILRSRGKTVRKTIDCLIATTCITNGFALLHNGRDFDHFESLLGLRVIHPAEK